MKFVRFVVMLAVFVPFVACQNNTPKFTLLYSVEEPIGEIAKTVKEVMERNHNVEIELIIGEGSLANLDSLSGGKADFTITENHVPFRTGIQSLLPFYPQILHIFYKSDEVHQDFASVFYGRKVFIGLEGSGSYRFMQELFEFFGVDRSKFEITDNAFDNDVFCGFTDIIKSEYLLGFEGYKLFSFDSIEKFGRGSIAEGISLKFPQVKPFVIPGLTYGNLTEEPIITLTTDVVLAAREGLPEDLIYDMTKTIFRDQQEFTALSPSIYIDLTENFDRSKLNFPLANGARIYLDRDEPSFLERYAELAGVLFSIALALVSALISLSRWQSQKKKDRVDIFYKDLMDIKNELPTIHDVRKGLEKINEVKAAQNKAFEMLIDEKLTADESFRIYMELSKETINEIRLRIKQMRLEAQK